MGGGGLHLKMHVSVSQKKNEQFARLGRICEPAIGFPTASSWSVKSIHGAGAMNYTQSQQPGRLSRAINFIRLVNRSVIPQSRVAPFFCFCLRRRLLVNYLSRRHLAVFSLYFNRPFCLKGRVRNSYLPEPRRMSSDQL